MGFVDEAQIHVKGGNGGAGSVSFRREAHVPRGGPDGGDGGKGGDVWLVADHQLSSLLGFHDRPHRVATSGAHGAGGGRHGRSGTDLIVRVPEGTVVKDIEGTVLADLARSGERFLAGRGGQGGRGNSRFLSNARRAPSFAEQGEKGEERWLNLELKLMADVALVGFPNAGKSTLISRISAAKPKIADYPFTTLTPNLGVVRLDDTEFVVADIPGLIEGASEGRGLGHQFLRHIERARVIVVLADLEQTEERSPEEQVEVLLDELGRYQPDMLERPRLVIGTKGDVVDGLEDELIDWSGPRISALTGAGLRELVGQMAQLVSEARATRAVGESTVIHRPEPEGLHVERGDDGAFIVRGRPAERAVALSDITDAQALLYVQSRLKAIGVDRALAQAGAREGDLVHISGFTFEWTPD